MIASDTGTDSEISTAVPPPSRSAWAGYARRIASAEQRLPLTGAIPAIFFNGASWPEMIRASIVQIIPGLVTNTDAAIAASGREHGRIDPRFGAPPPGLLERWREQMRAGAARLVRARAA